MISGPDAGFSDEVYRIEHRLHPWVSLVIVPVFALANAGVDILGKVAPGS